MAKIVSFLGAFLTIAGMIYRVAPVLIYGFFIFMIGVWELFMTDCDAP
jgi:hypothetical protein